VRDEFSFGEVASLLQVSDTEIDEWVVKAVSSNLMDVKINQLALKVTKSANLATDLVSQVREKLTRWQLKAQQLWIVVHTPGKKCQTSLCCSQLGTQCQDTQELVSRLDWL
jgi:hypothetical protein